MTTFSAKARVDNMWTKKFEYADKDTCYLVYSDSNPMYNRVILPLQVFDCTEDNSPMLPLYRFLCALFDRQKVPRTRKPSCTMLRSRSLPSRETVAMVPARTKMKKPERPEEATAPATTEAHAPLTIEAKLNRNKIRNQRVQAPTIPNARVEPVTTPPAQIAETVL